MSHRTRIISILVVLLALAALASFMLWPKAAATPRETQAPVSGNVVTLTEDGFVPAELSVAVGDTVTFRTESGKPFWPASHPHPAHSLYPEFDPELPVKQDATWSFTFTKAGDWGYHDHLAPYFTGTIHVTE